MELPELTDIHESFLTLSRIARERFGGTLGGRLLLRPEFNVNGAAVVIAASIAGAASLCVDGDGERLREGLRGGYVDFVVGTLDEALRILKNEIRRARAISVGVTGNPQVCVDTMIERGLQPDLLSALSETQASLFEVSGSMVVPDPALAEPGTALLAWSVAETPFQVMQRLSEVAQGCLDPQRAETPARRRWLEQSPRYLGRAFARHQCLRMASAESAEFLPRVHGEFPDADVTCNGETV